MFNFINYQPQFCQSITLYQSQQLQFRLRIPTIVFFLSANSLTKHFYFHFLSIVPLRFSGTASFESLPLPLDASEFASKSKSPPSSRRSSSSKCVKKKVKKHEILFKILKVTLAIHALIFCSPFLRTVS